MLLDALAPFREDLVIGVECMFSWYWVADLCDQEKIPFVLGHALYMGEIHGSKSKNGRIRDLELFLVQRAKQHDATVFHRLRTVPGIGKILAMTILYEIHDIARFPRVQDFASYARLVKGAKESAGKRKGTSGAKMGNVHLKWAFSEVAVLFLAKCERGKAFKARLEKKHGKGKSLSILAHKLGRAVFPMLSRKTAFDLERFLKTN